MVSQGGGAEPDRTFLLVTRLTQVEIYGVQCVDCPYICWHSSLIEGCQWTRPQWENGRKLEYSPRFLWFRGRHTTVILGGGGRLSLHLDTAFPFIRLGVTGHPWVMEAIEDEGFLTDQQDIISHPFSWEEHRPDDGYCMLNGYCRIFMGLLSSCVCKFQFRDLIIAEWLVLWLSACCAIDPRYSRQDCGM